MTPTVSASPQPTVKKPIILPSIEQIKGEFYRRNFHEFMKASWKIIEPATPFKDNWHLGAICEHLNAIRLGQIKRLIVNVPPRTSKSTIFSVIWPAWMWIDSPATRWIFASYSQALSTRDSVRCRRVIESSWYSKKYDHVFRISDDQNMKNRYENTKTGYRIATSVGGIGTGEGGDIIVVDDPHNVTEVESDVVRESVLTWWDETMSTRFNDLREGIAVIIMQRVHDMDLAGHLLRKGGWEHLCLPMEWDGKRRTTILGPYDVRKEEGELLWPDRFSGPLYDLQKKTMGSYAVAGQYQQDPVPRGGRIIKQEWWRKVPSAQWPKKDEYLFILQAWDTAFKEKQENDYSVCLTLGMTKDFYWILNVFKDRLGFPRLKKEVSAQATLYRPNKIIVEDKASGQSLYQELKLFSRLPIHAVGVDRDKVARVFSITPVIEAGQVCLPEEAPWLEDFLEEVSKFPVTEHDDQVDALSLALRQISKEEKLLSKSRKYVSAVEGLYGRILGR